jgi:hypothetical protein
MAQPDVILSLPGVADKFHESMSAGVTVCIWTKHLPHTRLLFHGAEREIFCY